MRGRLDACLWQLRVCMYCVDMCIFNAANVCSCLKCLCCIYWYFVRLRFCTMLLVLIHTYIHVHTYIRSHSYIYTLLNTHILAYICVICSAWNLIKRCHMIYLLISIQIEYTDCCAIYLASCSRHNNISLVLHYVWDQLGAFSPFSEMLLS